mmetsp:Transcript_23796/g.51981  ORF Transcript_23796/g.51981 Transcript_23796/m.51981 type:complete len:236 (-) Transcript_23796:449-1156(-)
MSTPRSLLVASPTLSGTTCTPRRSQPYQSFGRTTPAGRLPRGSGSPRHRHLPPRRPPVLGASGLDRWRSSTDGHPCVFGRRTRLFLQPSRKRCGGGIIPTAQSSSTPLLPEVPGPSGIGGLLRRFLQSIGRMLRWKGLYGKSKDKNSSNIDFFERYRDNVKKDMVVINEVAQAQEDGTIKYGWPKDPLFSLRTLRQILLDTILVILVLVLLVPFMIGIDVLIVKLSQVLLTLVGK